MSRRFCLPLQLRHPYQQELLYARQAFAHHDLPLAWHHLERAHIIGQAYPLAHTRVHWQMFCFGWQTRNLAEILGQVPRLVLGFWGSLVGKIPVGNTGGSNVPMLQSMPMPADLRELLAQPTGEPPRAAG